MGLPFEASVLPLTLPLPTVSPQVTVEFRGIKQFQRFVHVAAKLNEKDSDKERNRTHEMKLLPRSVH